MSPMRKTAGKKVAATRKRNAAKRQAAAKKAASTRKSRAAGKKAAATRKHRAAGRKAAKTRMRRAAQERQQQPAPVKKKRLRPLSQCKSKSRPHQSLRCRRHPKPASPSKLRQTSKASATSGGFFPSTENRHFTAPILGN